MKRKNEGGTALGCGDKKRGRSNAFASHLFFGVSSEIRSHVEQCVPKVGNAQCIFGLLAFDT